MLEVNTDGKHIDWLRSHSVNCFSKRFLSGSITWLGLGVLCAPSMLVFRILIEGHFLLMAFTIHDRNGNLYLDISNTKSTMYLDLKSASEVIAKLPVGYIIKDTNTKKKVEPYVK